jgi:DNA adenine methylase
MSDPVVKWAGGKRQLLDEIRSCFPVQFERYHEPFIGGGAIFFDTAPDAGSINDLNSHLITLYRVIRNRPENLIEINRNHEYEEEYYYDARQRFNELVKMNSLSESQRVEKASLLLYLNRTCYNGLYRENSSGEFNVPFGRHTNPDMVRERQIRTAHEALENIYIYNQDFSYITEEATAQDLVYFDPPYDTGSASSDFTQYQAEDFDREDQRRLNSVANTLHRQNIWVIISNSPSVTELYEEDDFEIVGVSAARTINSDSSNRDDVSEVLITNIPTSERRQPTLESFGE